MDPFNIKSNLLKLFFPLSNSYPTKLVVGASLDCRCKTKSTNALNEKFPEESLVQNSSSSSLSEMGNSPSCPKRSLLLSSYKVFNSLQDPNARILDDPLFYSYPVLVLSCSLKSCSVLGKLILKASLLAKELSRTLFYPLFQP